MRYATLSLVALTLTGAVATAAPPHPKIRPIKIFNVTPTTDPTTNLAPSPPTTTDRTSALSVHSPGLTLPPLAWAQLTPRRPSIPDRGALIIARAIVADAHHGIARWAASSDFSCMAVGCPGFAQGPVPNVGLQLWIDADKNHDYLAVCRVQFPSGSGDIDIGSEGSLSMTHHVTHKPGAWSKVSFVVGTDKSGWVGFAISGRGEWASTGCTLDELG